MERTVCRGQFAPTDVPSVPRDPNKKGTSAVGGLLIAAAWIGRITPPVLRSSINRSGSSFCGGPLGCVIQPPVEFIANRQYCTSVFTGRPMDRHSVECFIPLGGAYTNIQVIGNFLPRMKDLPLAHAATKLSLT